ncbi:MAG: beta-N-acetylglucosaminidase domain-containing protein [Aeromonadaceae bacterium]
MTHPADPCFALDTPSTMVPPQRDPSAPPLGLIEGFFGKSWSWQHRIDYANWLRQHGYDFYLYAPKDDGYLRRHWQLPWPAAQQEQLKTLASSYRAAGLAFGVGLTPLGAHHDYPKQRDALLAKVKLIDDELAPDILAVLFDDMPSDTPALASLQLTIAHDIAAHTRAKRLIFCPSFYSTDPILEQVFGAMPTNYWPELGGGLDPQFDLFWTGPKVCSSDYPLDHLSWVADTLKRKPFLWDNYPVNDGKRACNFLYLRSFTHRPPQLLEHLAGHAVNPMKQALLSRLPLATLPLSYRLGERYQPETIWHSVAQAELGDELAALLTTDLPLLADVGLAQLSEADIQRLQQRYQPFAHQPAMAELLGWLAGNDQFDPACLTD